MVRTSSCSTEGNWIMTESAVLAGSRPEQQGHSTVTPAALIGPAHFSVSLLTKVARYCGVARSSEATWAPRLVSRSRTSGVLMAPTAAALSLATTAGGAPFGRKIAFQV